MPMADALGKITRFVKAPFFYGKKYNFFSKTGIQWYKIPTLRRRFPYQKTLA
jgi:hypothetical protein